ncbi:MAG: biopolymer transporter ExbD [bacterium]
MRIHDKPKRKVQINVTSLIDVLFILLIFFMVSSTFLEQPGMKLELPKAKSAQVEQIDNLIIYVDRRMQIFLNDKPVAVDRLEKQLRETIADNESPTLVLRADKAVPHGLVVTIMDVAKQVGVKRLVVGTEVDRGGN